MKAEVLKSGLQTISQVTNSPVLFAVKNKVLYLGAHSETVTVVMTAETDHEDFHYVLPPEHARQIAKTLKTGVVDIIDDGKDNVIIQSGKSKALYTSMSIDSISFKLLMMHYKDEFVYRISGPELTKGFQSILAFSVSDVDDQRVKNLHFSIETNQVEVAASNNFTIAKYTFPSEKSCGNGDLPLTLVSKSFAFLTKTFGEFIDIGFSGKKLYYKTEDGVWTYKVTLPLVDVPPFKYRDLFSKLESTSSSSEVLLEKDEFIEQGKNFLYFTDEDVRNRVKIAFTPASFLIEGDNAKGTFTTELTPLTSTGSGSMFISLDYLTKAANAVSSSEFRLKMVDNKVLVKDHSFSVIIPPLRN